MKSIYVLMQYLILSGAVFGEGIAGVPSLTSAIATKTAADVEENVTGILFRSSDGGATWLDVSAGLPQDLFIRSVYAKDEAFFIGTRDGYFFHCLKPGTGIWVQQGIGGTISYESITGIFPGYSGTYVSIYGVGLFRKSTDGQWQHLSKNLEGPEVHDVLENEQGVILVSGPKGIYKSTDDGTTWKMVFNEGWAGDLSLDDGMLVANSSSGLLRSADTGETWKNTLKDEGAIYSLRIIEDHFVAIRTAGPWRTESENIPQHIYTSADGGATWQNHERFSAFERIYQLEQVGLNFFVSGPAGISRSGDGGITWGLVHPAPSNQFLRFELVVSGEDIYAVAMSRGC